MKAIGYLNGQWTDQDQMAISIGDLGFLQGVIAVERLRTWHARLPFLEAHLSRFRRTTEALKIERLPSDAELASLVHQLLDKNGTATDSGIVLFATPGRLGSATLGIHLSPLDPAKLQRMRRDGQRLIITDVHQPSIDCWPRDIKVRCRIHYYLADQQAREVDPEALGVLLDDDGSITETSIANVIAVAGERLLVPPEGRILPGVILGAISAIARQEGIPLERRPISPQMLRQADEVMLSGTEAGLWPASQIDRFPKTPGPLCRRLQSLLEESLAAV